ncbi:hypothetical protein ASC89_21800 [Devosia sp. Root413D1]|nr:hypothetical protein ASC89_21800 [Devosia sp. Root413D1]
MARYDGRATIPVDELVWYYFLHLNVEQLIRKAGADDMPSPSSESRRARRPRRGYGVPPN